MDALLAYIPALNYWVIALAVSLLLNVYQFARARDLSGTIKHIFEHGHAPEGKAIVPTDSLARAIEPRIVPAATTTIPPPWKGKP